MKSYKNLAGNVGICSYEFGEKRIRIKFHSRKSVVYTHKNSGEDHIDKMMLLAAQGFGLSRYINENESDLKAFPLD